MTAVAAVIAEAWNDLTLTKRSLFWSTATGAGLDVKAAEEGLTRKAAIAASTIVVFKGTFISGTSTGVGSGFLDDSTKAWTPSDFIDGVWILIDSALTEFTITGNTATRISVSGTPASGAYYVLPKVPSGTTVKSSISGVSFTTDSDVIVGKDNVGLAGQSSSIGLGSRTTATATVSGSSGEAQANTITLMSPAINGILSVTNPVPTSPRIGLDAETDDALRERRQTLFSVLNVDTQAFYEALAIAGNSDVLRVIARRSEGAGAGIYIYVRSRSGADLSGGALTALETYIGNRSRSFFTITASNVAMTDIFVQFSCTLQPGITLQDLYIDVADKIADFLDFSTWDPEDHIIDDDILSIILNAQALKNLDIGTLTVTATKSAVPVGSGDITLIDSLPRLARVSITDTAGPTTLDLVLSHNSISA